MKSDAMLVIILWASAAAICQTPATPTPQKIPPAELGFQTPYIAMAERQVPDSGLLAVSSHKPPAIGQIPKSWPARTLKLIPTEWPKFQVIPVDGGTPRVIRTAFVFAQNAAYSAVDAAPAQTAVSPVRPLAFDVVSIKQNKSGGGGASGRTTPDGDLNINSPLAYQIAPAYGVEPDNIYGLPNWAKNNRYDIQTKVAPEDIETYRKLSRAEHRQMMQAVFEDRLKLRAHLESKEVSMYQLVIAKGGPKLHEAKRGGTYVDGMKAPDGTPVGGRFSMMGHGFYTGQQVTVRDLINMLRGPAGRPVIDKTGLTGEYDITLRWAPDAGSSLPASASPEDTEPSIFTALEEQLGLKLEPTKGTVPTLIIDHIEPPTEN